MSPLTAAAGSGISSELLFLGKGYPFSSTYHNI
jgi:hypothetical protein